MTLTVKIILTLIIVSQNLSAQQHYVLRGSVRDTVTQEPLSAANVRVLGTSKGTITNSAGDYSLSLTEGEYTIIVSYLGYFPDTLTVLLDSAITHDVTLKPSPIQMPEMLVLAEDPAIEIIRKAIANKRKWMGKLKSYKFDAFTRQVIRRDTAIASITESYTTGYMLIGDTLREIVRQKRQTENIPGEENFAAVHSIINFNEDKISLFTVITGNKSTAFTLIGPTAPEALDYYDYKLIGISVVNGIEIYKIKMTPKSRLRPLFDGTITIADETFAVMGVDLKPNETLTFPFLKDIELRYRQQFALFDTIFWMPIDNRINGGLSISLLGISMPRVGIEATSSLYDYELNVTIPDSLLHKRRLTVDSSSLKFDTTYWAQHEVLPLTPEEQASYRTLDSAQTLDKQFKPSGPLATLAGGGGISALEHIDARFNRVEGFYLGGNMTSDSLFPFTRLEGEAGYGFAAQLFQFRMRGTLFSSRKRNLGLGAEVRRNAVNFPDGGYFGPFTISLMALIDKNDYRDYYLSKAWSLFLQYTPSQTLDLQLTYLRDNQRSLMKATDYSFFSTEKVYRPNPGIDEGLLSSLQLRLRLGEPSVPLDLVSRNALEIEVEHSQPDFLGSSFNFTRYNALLDLTFTTFAHSLLFPPHFRIRAFGGYASGTLPLQRFFYTDSRASGDAPFGVLKGGSVKEFAGDRVFTLAVEHNFRSVPFLFLNIPFLYHNGIELIVHGAVSQSWLKTVSTSHGWYSEAGVGVSRIFDFFRFDLTYRFMHPKTLHFTVSTATFF
jgi:hypothetical protein